MRRSYSQPLNYFSNSTLYTASACVASSGFQIRISIKDLDNQDDIYYYLKMNLLDYALQSRQREAWMWFQFQSDDLLRANTSHLRIMSKGALAAWIESRFGIPVLLTSCQKGPQRGPWNWSPMCSLCSLTSLFEVFCLEPSKSWFQSTSRLKHVSWVHGTFAEINYYPKQQQQETSVRNHART